MHHHDQNPYPFLIGLRYPLFSSFSTSQPILQARNIELGYRAILLSPIGLDILSPQYFHMENRTSCIHTLPYCLDFPIHRIHLWSKESSHPTWYSRHLQKVQLQLHHSKGLEPC